ncbi:tyrosine-type recombinase/integrase [Brevibacillus choshinensis]|uniref:tyrosine-type recombinase/integrase n=2 Tax=Brevibacillus choshinensis TaxID=54911 RepID=UPI002E249B48|nr:tyrosine-type recombinase/integrase [Brevibacillus choshinensis]MED4582490.1 tyrosine-type recombinase/integrase [Brevibacillus choshinensis]
MQVRQAIDEFLSYMQVERNVSVNTIRSYAYDLHVFEAFLQKVHGITELQHVYNSTIRRFVQDQVIEHQTQPRTLQRRISCLKSFCRFCAKEKWITNEFMVGIQAPKTDKKLPVYMKLIELQQLFRFLEADQRKFALRNHVMFKLLATTGMRRQELVDLTWEQMDLESDAVRIYGKGNKERILPLHRMVLPLIQEYREQLEAPRLHPKEPVFTNYLGESLDPRGLHRIFKEVLQHAGLPPHRFTLHHLRHTFATLLLRSKDTGSKVDIRTLQELLGHESLATTSIYTHVDLEQKKQAIESLQFDM